MSPEERTKLIREQVTAKILSGASWDEVADWLVTQGIDADEAGQMLETALKKRGAVLRDRAMVRLAFAAAGLILVAAFAYIRFGLGVMLDGTFATIVHIVVFMVGLASLRALIQGINLFRVDPGGTVD